MSQKVPKYIKLTAQDISSSLAKLNGSERPLATSWRLNAEKNAIIRNIQFKSFEDTWGYLTKVAMRSHLKGHHPEIFTVYNKVEIKLTTHDITGLSQLDFELASRFDKLCYNEKITDTKKQ